MTEVYIAIGSNVGDRQKNIQQAINSLNIKVQAIKRAPIYETRPVGFKDQSNFMNTVISGLTDSEPLELLQEIKLIEESLGRTKTFLNGPREIDIDIILYGDKRLKSQLLTVPHPKYLHRDFVLLPLLDIDENLVDPESSKKLSDILNSLPNTELSIIRCIES